jgi:hypothetical protein
VLYYSCGSSNSEILYIIVLEYFTTITIMGSNSSKQSLEIERNKRLREFEEELVEHNNDNSSLRRGSASSPPIRDHHFMENDQNAQQRRGSSSVSDLLREDFETESELGRVEGEDKNDSKEVEDAIAELEETFRTLTPSKVEGNLVPSGERQEESDAYRLMKEFSRSQSCGPLNINPQQSQGQSFQGGGGGGETRERRGTPMQGASHNTYRRHRPMGLAHLSRSSGGLGNNSISSGDAMDMKGALSAPPGVSNLRESLPQPPQWTPVSI